MSNIFEQASRNKLRFATAKGSVTVEDLWDLPLTSNTGRANLDDIAKGLYRELKTQDDVSFVKPAPTGAMAEVQLAFDIAKYVIDVRVAERDAAAQAAEKSEKKQKLLALIDRKQDQELEGKSVEDLRAMVNAL